MKNIFLIILIFITKMLLSQDTMTIIKLKPIYSITLQNLKAEEELIKQNKYITDSLNNSDVCKNKVKAYRQILENNNAKITETQKIVKDLNEQNAKSAYYYFITYECISTYFNFEGCGRVLTFSSDCVELKLKVDKREKSRIFLDGPSGEVFYYEDIKRTPR